MPGQNIVTAQFGDFAEAITASDSTVFVPSTIYVGTAGNVAIARSADGVTVIFTNLSAGAVVPCRAVKVLATGTTASGLVRCA